MTRTAPFSQPRFFPLRAIFFDIGDTLVFDDPPLPERLWRAMQSVGITANKTRLPEAYRLGEKYAAARYVKGAAWDDPDALREAVARILTALDVPALDMAGWNELSAAFQAVPFVRLAHPGAIPLLEELRRRRFTLGGISDWDETLPDLLAELQIAPYFDALAVSDIVGVRKPHPRLFQEALRQAGVQAEEALHIGDWYELDVCGARAAEMQALLFDWEGRTPEADCPRVVNFDELCAYLLALPVLGGQ